LTKERLAADFNDDSILELSPDLVGPSITRNSGIIGEGVEMSLEHPGEMRPSTLVFHLTQRLLNTKWRDPGEEPKLYLFGQLKRITRQWLDTCLVCKGGTYPAQLSIRSLRTRPATPSQQPLRGMKNSRRDEKDPRPLDFSNYSSRRVRAESGHRRSESTLRHLGRVKELVFSDRWPTEACGFLDFLYLL
jgi:type III restriction enzyme